MARLAIAEARLAEEIAQDRAADAYDARHRQAVEAEQKRRDQIERAIWERSLLPGQLEALERAQEPTDSP